MRILWGLVRSMRPKQWTKNLIFVFPGIVFDGKLFEPEAFARVFTAFLLLNVVSGAVYIINDLVDVESDRRHPTKRFRPIPAGELPVPAARVFALVIPLAAVAVSLLALQSGPLTLVIAAYLALQVLYSFALKNIVIVDVLAITAGFILRVAAGVVVIEVENFSPWLYACTGLLALFLVIGKRRQELILLGDAAATVRRSYKEYNIALIDEMLRVVTTGTLLTYTLYTIETDSRLLAGNHLALSTVPFVMYGLFRYLYLIHVRGEGSAPDEVLLRDRPLQIDILLFGLAYVVILYLLPGSS